jgi:hypothetical protein
LENLKGRGYLGDIGVDGKIVLKWILRTELRAWTGLNWLRKGSNGELF